MARRVSQAGRGRGAGGYSPTSAGVGSDEGRATRASRSTYSPGAGSESHADHPFKFISDAASFVSGAGAAFGSAVGGAINEVRSHTDLHTKQAMGPTSTHALDRFRR